MVHAHELYRACRERMTVLAGGLTHEQADWRVPATPDWTIRQVYAHLVGVVDDILQQRLQGVGTPEWTQTQVDARRDRSLASIVAEWNELAPAYENVIGAMAEDQFDARPMMDVWGHEQDIRPLVGEPDGWNDGIAAWFLSRNGRFLARFCKKHEVALHFTDAPHISPDTATTTLRISAPEFVRGTMGRRSMGQLAAWPWDGPIDLDAAVPDLLYFGTITDVDIIDRY